MNFIKAELDDKSSQVQVTYSKDLNLSLALQLLGTLALGILNTGVESLSSQVETNKDLKPSEKKAAIKGIKDSMYDAANSVFSSVLNIFDPDSARSSITEEAILTLENQILEERYNKLSNEEKAQYRQHFNKLKLQSEFRRNMYDKANTAGNKEAETKD